MRKYLNESQQQVLDKILYFLEYENGKYYGLYGAGGTGKTFLISQLIKKLNDSSITIFVCAPTNTALENIKSAISENLEDMDKINIKYFTIQHFFFIVPRIDNKGNIHFCKSKERITSPSNTKQVLIIDECSMLDKNIVTILNEYVMLPYNKTKVIIVGDPSQLPPVNESESSIFKEMTNNPFCSTLENVIRTNSIDILNVLSIVRLWNRKDSVFSLIKNYYPNRVDYTVILSKNNNTNIYKNKWFLKYKKRALRQGAIILAWTNKTVDNYNKNIRKHLFHFTSDDLKKGENIVFKNCYRYIDEFKRRITIASSTIASIKDIVDSSQHELYNWIRLISDSDQKFRKRFKNVVKKISQIENHFRVVTLKISKEKEDFLIKIIDISEKSKYYSYLEHVKGIIENYSKTYNTCNKILKLWDIYYNKLIYPYAQIGYGYSMTVHRSQGSTFPYVFVDITDISKINSISDFHKCFYTAVSRAKYKLYLLIQTE